MQKSSAISFPATRIKPESDSAAANGVTLKSFDQRKRRIPRARFAVTARLVFIILAVIIFCHIAAVVVIPVVLAVFAAMMLKPPVCWLRKCHVPVAVAAALVVTIFAISMGSGLIYLGRPAMEWVNAAPENLPKLKEKFSYVLRHAARLSAAASSVGSLAPAGDEAKKVQPVEVRDNQVARTVFTWTGSLLAGIGETMALIFLLLAFGDNLISKFVGALPTSRDKKRVVEISHDIQQSISTYLSSVGLINIGFGLAVGLILHLLNMPNAIMWGGVAAFANFIPYFGPILGIAAVGGAGLLAFDHIGPGLAPACAYLLLHLLETNFITPFVLGRRFALNPVIIFIALIFCIWLWGIVGALLAVPILVTLKIVCERVEAFSSLEEFLAD